MKKSRKLQINFLSLVLSFIGVGSFFLCNLDDVQAASNLSELPFGSVISIQPQDTQMCNDEANCTAKTDNVLPFKFVKMQGRKTDTSATPYGNVNGYEINGENYTYWMLLDNYCWWNSSDCRYYDGTRHSNYGSWNAQGSTTGTYSSNITDTKSNNILKTLANFYNTLPDEIGNVPKDQAIPNFNWDMYGVYSTSPPTTGWAGGTWTNKTLTYSSVPFQFTGSNTAPVMNSKIGLVSFHEWQGTNTHYQTNPTTNNGSGGSFCLARFGTSNCAATSGNMFDENNTALACSVPGCNTIASATNPRPRLPWTRTSYSTETKYVWFLYGNASYSLSNDSSFNYYGVSPTLWLLGDLETVDGEGTYINPFIIDANSNFCDLPENSDTLACLPFGSVIQIAPTDEFMWDCTASDNTCSTQTSVVQPFKFVKMQARKTDTQATPYGNENGYEIDGENYTYWMFLDNYCWWGKANCQSGFFDGVWEGDSNSGFSHRLEAYQGIYPSFDNNISRTQTPNFLQTLANFYDSLPVRIGNLKKEVAIPTFSWDMSATSNATPPTVGWSGGSWTNSIYNPNNNSASQFTLTGSETAPIMNSRISLVSFHEWQGANSGYVTNPTDNNGSGGSFCLARFGTSDCAASFGYLFNDANNGFSCSVPNCNLATSATNPRPRHPLTRTPSSVDSTNTWFISGSSALSLFINGTDSQTGVSPTLWLRADLKTSDDEGEGTYVNPYNLSSKIDSEIEIISTSGNSTDGIKVEGLATGNATNQTLVIMADACNTLGQCLRKTVTRNSGDPIDAQEFSLEWSPAELPPGTYNGTIWVRMVADGEAYNTQSGAVNFTIADSEKEIRLTVIKNQTFEIDLGKWVAFDLTAGTNSGVTLTNVSGEAKVAGTLNESKTLTFGKTNLIFKAIDLPASTVKNVSIY